MLEDAKLDGDSGQSERIFLFFVIGVCWRARSDSSYATRESKSESCLALLRRWMVCGYWAS